jgi:hypothetical protein
LKAHCATVHEPSFGPDCVPDKQRPVLVQKPQPGRGVHPPQVLVVLHMSALGGVEGGVDGGVEGGVAVREQSDGFHAQLAVVQAPLFGPVPVPTKQRCRSRQ